MNSGIGEGGLRPVKDIKRCCEENRLTKIILNTYHSTRAFAQEGRYLSAMKRPRRIRTIILILILVIVLIQFLPVNRSAPPVDPAQDFVAVTNPPANLGILIKDACYDCHSHETEYPWYSYVAPVAQWLQGHVKEGRENLNFSVWTTYSAEDADGSLEEAVEMVEEKEMPLKSFTWGHPEARLTDAQRAELVQFFKSLRTGASDRLRPEQEEDEDD